MVGASFQIMERNADTDDQKPVYRFDIFDTKGFPSDGRVHFQYYWKRHGTAPHHVPVQQARSEAGQELPLLLEMARKPDGGYERTQPFLQLYSHDGRSR